MRETLIFLNNVIVEGKKNEIKKEKLSLENN